LKLELLSKVPDQILTDPTRLRQILFNVIGNAIKFTSKGDVIVRLNYIPAEAMLVMDVNDSGIGITPAQEEKIFNPFMQADASTTRKFGGTGLGLSLSRKLATALGGDIELTWSEFGKGSTFRVTIKVAEVTNTRLIDANEIVRSESQSVSRSKPADQCLTGLTVLLVEDSAENQMLISRFIRLAGAVVVTASNGAEAVDAVHLRLAQNQNFDLVLMDIQMPVMDGYEATRTLRHEGFKAPIIALTAHAFEEERHRCIQAGCNEHLTKPVNRDLLVSTIFNYATVMKSKPAGVNKSGVLGTEIVADPTLKPDPVLGP
jgi:CheY-like chemotaxis protein